MSTSIRISFDTPIYKDIIDINFIEDNNKIYYDSCYMNYIYNTKINNKSITIHGFFKDDFLVIIINSFDENLLVNIDCKEVILIKLEWKNTYINKKDIHINVIKNNKNLNTEAYLLSIRNKLFKNNINLNDYLKICEYKIIDAIINDNGNENTHKNYNLISKIKVFIKSLN